MTIGILQRHLESPRRGSVALLLACFILFVGHNQTAFPDNPDQHSRLHILEQQTSALSGLSVRLERNPNQYPHHVTCISFAESFRALMIDRTATLLSLEPLNFSPLQLRLIYSQNTSTYL